MYYYCKGIQSSPRINDKTNNHNHVRCLQNETYEQTSHLS